MKSRLGDETASGLFDFFGQRLEQGQFFPPDLHIQIIHACFEGGADNRLVRRGGEGRGDQHQVRARERSFQASRIGCVGADGSHAFTREIGVQLVCKGLNFFERPPGKDDFGFRLFEQVAGERSAGVTTASEDEDFGHIASA
jgi:hypothetical protein